MKQLLQNLRDGKLSVVEAPDPVRPAGFALVANRASLISSGTERSTVLAAQASLLGKARQRPDKVRQVLDNIRKEGLRATIAKVQEKLDQPKALGYSSAGVVLACDDGETRFVVGEAVACAGQDFASHADLVVVPRNLVVPLPKGVSFEQGAFGAVGAIALQGVRRAEVQLGSRVLVIGLGLIGQLAWMLLESSGCVVIGTDVSEYAVGLAKQLGLRHVGLRGADDIELICRQVSEGYGVDAVIITASTTNTDPIELAGAVARERARVVVVGSVNLAIPRDPHYYRKELDVIVSRSYGPGRYDREYEEGGVDYPQAQVRWSEGRNIQAFLEAVARGDVRVDKLTTHRFALESATNAYDIVSGARREDHSAILLTYPETVRRSPVVETRTVPVATQDAGIRIGFVGAGSFARSYLLPHLQRRRDVSLASVATARAYTAIDAAKKFNFSRAVSTAEQVCDDPDIDAVFIATRHDQHAYLAKRALACGKHVFVEKPLALTRTDLDELVQVASTSGRVLQVGFNRRFSPLAIELRDMLMRSQAPAQVTYRVNAGQLPEDHWLLDPQVGGGRMVGEGCHFLDLIQYLCGSQLCRVIATRFGDDATGATSVLATLSNGSIATLVYQANASPRLAKERIEAFAGGRGGIIDDWRRLDLFDGRTTKARKASGQAKGYSEEIESFLSSIRSGQSALSLDEQVVATLATFAVVESCTTGRPVTIE